LMIKNSEYLISGLLSTGDNFDDAVRCLPVCHLMLLAYARPLQIFDFFFVNLTNDVNMCNPSES